MAGGRRPRRARRRPPGTRHERRIRNLAHRPEDDAANQSVGSRVGHGCHPDAGIEGLGEPALEVLRELVHGPGRMSRTASRPLNAVVLALSAHPSHAHPEDPPERRSESRRAQQQIPSNLGADVLDHHRVLPSASSSSAVRSRGTRRGAERAQRPRSGLFSSPRRSGSLTPSKPAHPGLDAHLAVGNGGVPLTQSAHQPSWEREGDDPPSTPPYSRP